MNFYKGKQTALSESMECRTDFVLNLLDYHKQKSTEITLNLKNIVFMADVLPQVLQRIRQGFPGHKGSYHEKQQPDTQH